MLGVELKNTEVRVPISTMLCYDNQIAVDTVF